MASLKDFFPDGVVRAAIERRLKPGAVIKVVQQMDDGQEHPKRFVVVQVCDNVIACVMNSEINPIIARNPDTLRCQVGLSKALPYTDKDCHLDCSRLRILAKADVVDQLIARDDGLLGDIDEVVRDQMVAAIKSSKTIAVIDAIEACESLAAITF